jgi:hypothetical protein
MAPKKYRKNFLGREKATMQSWRFDFLNCLLAEFALTRRVCFSQTIQKPKTKIGKPPKLL